MQEARVYYRMGLFVSTLKSSSFALLLCCAFIHNTHLFNVNLVPAKAGIRLFISCAPYRRTKYWILNLLDAHLLNANLVPAKAGIRLLITRAPCTMKKYLVLNLCYAVLLYKYIIASKTFWVSCAFLAQHKTVGFKGSLR